MVMAAPRRQGIVPAVALTLAVILILLGMWEVWLAAAAHNLLIGLSILILLAISRWFERRAGSCAD
jgi:Zn-dependent protease with chaperone function